MAISTKFAYLPYGIIREIVEYAGIALKMRNGKYMGQIPKDDSRYGVIQKIPIKKMIFNVNLDVREFMSSVILKPGYIYYQVSSFILSEQNYINYNLYHIYDGKPRMIDNYHWREEVGPSINLCNKE